MSWLTSRYREVAKLIAEDDAVAAAAGHRRRRRYGRGSRRSAFFREICGSAPPGIPEICDALAKTRPTAVDLFWALDRMKRRFAELTSQTSDLAKISKAWSKKRSKFISRKKPLTKPSAISAPNSCLATAAS